MTTVTMFGFVVNDMFDYRKDRAAGIERPLAAGTLSMKSAAGLAIAVLLGSALMSALVGRGVIVLAIASAMLLLYSPLAQRYTLFKDLYVAILCCLPLDYGAAVGGRGYPSLSYALVACFVTGREILMDADELDGDIRYGMRTIAAILGRRETARAGMVLMTLAAAATAVFVHGRLAVGMSAAGLALLAGIFTWPGLEQKSRISLTRAPMLLGAIAVACGGFS
jgi:4-hydroxybenzoate polyprenyltransferase